MLNVLVAIGECEGYWSALFSGQTGWMGVGEVVEQTGSCSNVPLDILQSVEI